MSNIEKIDRLIQSLIEEVPTLDTGFAIIDKYVKSIDESVDLGHFRNQLADSYKPFEDWLNRLLEKEKVPKAILAFNIGLFESEDYIQLYITGSTEWEINDDHWAANNDYFPEGRYPDISLYSELYNLLNENFYLGLFLTISSTITYTNTYLLEHSSRFSKGVIFATGFDDGDLYNFAKKTEETITVPT
ncbi:hypothetical protein CEY16_11500 [Halalkalibacillus sediminis]|uniref:Uncharacterized protein n=1 Tax=Halalkalibacillus sediminis TaxID=2018042 RepID=A0A2I0QTB5_9BACI|nr:hypothetical protein [Halalkalibacillus sediminis]PKR77350.1 hypothetical protein CEY16_11500 [Halalkalibacillus sediminis]